MGLSVGTSIAASYFVLGPQTCTITPVPNKDVKTTSLKSLHMDVTSLGSVVLVSSSCCNKGAQTGGLETTGSHHLMFWRLEAWDQGFGKTVCPRKSRGGRAGQSLPCLPSFQEPQSFLGLWQLSSSLCLHLHLLCFLGLCLCPDFPLIRTSFILD